MKLDFSTRPLKLALLLAWIVSMVPATSAHSSPLYSMNAAAQVQHVDNLWVDAISGNDQYDGLSKATAFRTIQRAADIASPGTTVHILPGVYRETVRPVLSGSARKPIVYRAENGPGTVIIRGSERTNTLVWSQLETNSIGLSSEVNPHNIYSTDLSTWALANSPRFVVQLGEDGKRVTRLPLAREPDWQVATEWKYAEFWWAADGGSTVAACDPSSDQNPDCDIPSRSATQLIDRTSDNAPAGMEAGNLTLLGDLTGATLVALDANEGHYVYRRQIIAHNVPAGQITVDRPCEFDSGSGRPGLGWGSKYYIENHAVLLDAPGEWWFDSSNSRLYLWPSAPGDPSAMNIEISRREYGFVLNNLSFIILDGLTMEFFNEEAFLQSQGCSDCMSYDNIVRNAAIRYANIGLEVSQGVEGPASVTDGFTLENSEVSHMDSLAIHLNYWWSGGTSDSFTHSGIVNTLIRNNEFYDLGFRTDGDNALGLLFNHADKLRFEGNHVHHVAQNGVAFSRSVVQSPKEGGFSPNEIKTGEILLKDNIFEKACLLNADCGELKIQGSAPDNHVFRDLLITGNVFRDTFGWTYISEKRGRWSGGTGSKVQGMGGFGLYVDNASGVHAYRNIAYNNASSGFQLYNYWWDGDIVYYNNVAANSLHGIRLDGNTQSSVNTQVANNIIVNNEGYGTLIYQAEGDYGKFLVDHNLYYQNGWRANEDGGVERPGAMALYRPNKNYQTLSAIQHNTPWEAHGMTGDPGFLSYDPADHDLFDGSWPDFRINSSNGNPLDKGTTSLPDSLLKLLNTFKVTNFRDGQAYDIGRYEQAPVVDRDRNDFTLLASPVVQVVCPGGVARYTLQSDPADLPYRVTLTVNSPSALLDIELSSPIVTSDDAVTLTVANNQTRLLVLPALEYMITVTATGGGFSRTTELQLIVGGIRLFVDGLGICLPIDR